MTYQYYLNKSEGDLLTHLLRNAIHLCNNDNERFTYFERRLQTKVKSFNFLSHQLPPSH